MLYTSHLTIMLENLPVNYHYVLGDKKNLNNINLKSAPKVFKVEEGFREFWVNVQS